MKKPSLFAIDRDDHHAEHVGHTADGRQFFLTNPFEPASGKETGGEFVALYLFDAKGKLLEAKIDSFGPRATLDEKKRAAAYQARLNELGKVKYGRIKIAPFSVTKFDLEFGLIARELDEDSDDWAIECMPGNYMCFFPPWNSGEYDT